MTLPPQRLDVPVRGGILGVARWGSRDPIVLAPHGITASHVGWGYVAEALADEATLLAPDLRGRGWSADLPGPWGLAGHADDLVAVLDHVGAARAVVAGHSMGAFVALTMAARHPERVAALALIDGGLRLPAPIPEDDAAIEALLQAIIGPAMDRLRLRFDDLDAYRDHWRAHPALASAWNPLVEAYVEHDAHAVDGSWRSRVRIDAVREDGRDTLVDRSLTAALSEATVPIHFLWAPRGLLDADPLYPREVVTEVAASVPSLSISEAVDVNHYTMLLTRAGAEQVADVIRATIAAAEVA